MVAIKEDAQDIVQNVFLAFYQNIERIDEKSALAYLFKIARNKSISWHRKHKRFILKPLEYFTTMPDNYASAPQSGLSVLQAAISRLSRQQSMAIHLKYFEQLSYKEMGQIMGLSEKSVDSILVRAKKKLRANIVLNPEGIPELRTSRFGS